MKPIKSICNSFIPNLGECSLSILGFGPFVLLSSVKAFHVVRSVKKDRNRVDFKDNRVCCSIQ